MPFIIFVDFDYFYAQVEEIMNPSIRDKPVVVCVYSGRTENSGAVATSNYIARSLGIKSGMPLPQALKVGKDKAIFLPIRRDFYKEFSDRVMKTISSYSDKMEIASIDEAYIDVTEECDNFSEAVALAGEIKEKIFKTHGMKASVGVSVNKVIAKVLGDMAKPDGLKYIDPEHVEGFLDTLEINKIPGIGSVLSSRLNDAGVHYIRDILRADPSGMTEILGNAKYNYLLDIAENRYSKPVEERVRKNFGRYMTLQENTRNPDIILPVIRKAVDFAYEKAPGTPGEISVIGIMEDLDIVSRSYSSGRITKENAYTIANTLLNKILVEDDRNFRRVGIRLGRITNNESLDDFFGV
ncbi:MAG: DNA polymerase IV [Ferroplasma sp.]|uniref:Y-family DNA polymerase n=1 Tax=Ferroplasma sp. TaxID=2591003 RepID=UPI0028167190|nr:DNA polymerase IV [Ferroplasma sp.]WMT52089.1 MAG: DNA polymerase IV [Ferroplasma sp.]